MQFCLKKVTKISQFGADFCYNTLKGKRSEAMGMANNSKEGIVCLVATIVQFLEVKK